MDGDRFDRMVRLLGRSATRRGGIGGALGGLLGLAAGGALAKPKGTGGGGASRGACGDGKDARCTTAADCCTGVCDKQAGQKEGRCRCRHQGEACEADKNCCSDKGQGLTCQGKKGKKTCQPKAPACGGAGQACCAGGACGEGFSCEGDPGGRTCQPNICAHTCVAADNFCNVPPANQCCGGKSGCRCMTTDDGPFCFGGAGYGGCEGTTAQGKVVPHCESKADCEAVFGANSGVECISASTFPNGSSCCPGVNQSACILPCPKD